MSKLDDMLTPEQIKAHAERQATLNRARGEVSTAQAWENIAQAAGYIVNLGLRIESKRGR
jgi:hypothetical protein